MKLRWINVDMVSTCINMGFGKVLWGPLRNHAEVISWYLSLRARKDGLTMLEATAIQIVGATGEFAGATLTHDNTQIIRTYLESSRLLSDLRKGNDTFEFLEKFTQDGFELLKKNEGLEIDYIYGYLNDFKSEGYECKTILDQRKPRGAGLTLQLEGHMTNDFLRLDFVAHDLVAEIYRETLMYEEPSRLYLGKPTHKIEFDGTRVSVSGQFRKPSFSEDGQLMLKTVKTLTERQIEYYMWERNLSEITLGSG